MCHQRWLVDLDIYHVGGLLQATAFQLRPGVTIKKNWTRPNVLLCGTLKPYKVQPSSPLCQPFLASSCACLDTQVAAATAAAALLLLLPLDYMLPNTVCQLVCSEVLACKATHVMEAAITSIHPSQKHMLADLIRPIASSLYHHFFFLSY